MYEDVGRIYLSRYSVQWWDTMSVEEKVRFYGKDVENFVRS